jgi:hypothetical protein
MVARIILRGRDREHDLRQALRLLGPSAFAYHPSEYWIIVPKPDFDRLVRILNENGIQATVEPLHQAIRPADEPGHRIRS